jgi:cytochrome b subunit of formate dehydrogenase
MRKKIYIIMGFLIALVALGIYSGRTGSSFGESNDMLVRAIGYGILVGGIRAVIRPKSGMVDGKAIRHDAASFLEHWGTAIGIFILIVSGALIGFYFLQNIPILKSVALPLVAEGDTDAARVWATNIHFTGVFITLFCGFFFATDFALSRDYKKLIPNIKEIVDGTLRKYMLRKPYHNEGKYLASQKAAFLSFVFLGVVVLLTGFIKVAGYMWAATFPPTGGVVVWATYFHDISGLLFFLLVIVHVAMIVMLRHWPSLKSWVSGTMSEQHVKEEHPIWYEELKKDAEEKTE